METLSPKEIAIRWFERVWQQRSKETIYELLGAETVIHQEGGSTAQGPEEFTRFHDSMLEAFSDFSLEILHALGDETQACLHWHVRGVHTGHLGPLAPTNEPVSFTGMSFLVVENGRVKEAWDSWDLGSLFAKLAAKNVG